MENVHVGLKQQTESDDTLRRYGKDRSAAGQNYRPVFRMRS
jgi:hypothetical protein